MAATELVSTSVGRLSHLTGYRLIGRIVGNPLFGGMVDVGPVTSLLTGPIASNSYEGQVQAISGVPWLGSATERPVVARHGSRAVASPTSIVGGLKRSFAARTMPSSDGNVRFRLLTENDLATGARLVHPAFAPRTMARADLPGIWLRLLRAEQLLGGVIVDRAVDEHEIVAFSAAVFVAERFVDEVLRAPRPFLAAHVYEAIRAGRSPVLDLEGVRYANSGDGLNLVILHYGQTDWNLASPRTRAILKAGHTGFPLAFDGYQLNRILEEVFPDQLAAKLAAGFLIKSTYGRDVELGKGDAPVLVGLFRDDPASRLPGSTAASAFHYRPPRFFFSPSEQRLLGRAAFDDADDRAIAERLDVSTDAVRQTWRRIYSRVAAVDASVLGSGALSDERFGTRGPEKRRHLLEYLRFHPEELRPSLKRASVRDTIPPSSGRGETMRSARASRAGR